MTGVTAESIMEYLKSEGIQCTLRDNGNVAFRFEFGNFVVAIDENDDQFLQIVMPGIFDVDDNNREDALTAANAVNVMKKVIKIIVIDEDVHVSAEILIDSTPNFGDFVPRIIGMLKQGREEFYHQIKNL